MLVMCPCTAGFFCPRNTQEPIYCIPGYYCPPDQSVNTDPFGDLIPANGYGAWGRSSFQCPQGFWCGTGQIQPFDCRYAGI